MEINSQETVVAYMYMYIPIVGTVTNKSLHLREPKYVHSAHPIYTSIKKQLQKIERKVGMEYKKEYKQG